VGIQRYDTPSHACHVDERKEIRGNQHERAQEASRKFVVSTEATAHVTLVPPEKYFNHWQLQLALNNPALTSLPVHWFIAWYFILSLDFASRESDAHFEPHFCGDVGFLYPRPRAAQLYIGSTLHAETACAPPVYPVYQGVILSLAACARDLPKTSRPDLRSPLFFRLFAEAGSARRVLV